MKENKKLIVISLKPFPAIVYVGFGYTSLLEVIDQIPNHKREMKKADVISETEVGATYCFTNRDCCLLFKNYFTSLYELDYVVHEVMHVTNHILDYFGVKRLKKCDETHAYFAQYIFFEIISVYKDRKLCIKKR